MRNHTKSLACAAVLVGLATAACGQSAQHRALVRDDHLVEAEGFAFDTLGMLRELHARMVAEKLPLREVQVLAAVVNDRDVTLTVTPGQPVWSPPGASDVPAMPVAYTVTALPQAEADFWRTAAVPAPALAVTTPTELLAIAPTEGVGGDVVTFDATATGPLFMAVAADQLATARYTPIPQVADHCGKTTGEPLAATARPALIGYFTTLGTSPELVRMQHQASLDRQAEQLAAVAPRTNDPVTGATVGVSVNALYEQLLRGVRVDDLRYEPTVPVTVNVAGVAPQAPDAPAQTTAVLVDTTTRDVLGWIPVVAVWSSEGDGQPTPDYSLTAEIRKPTPGASVGVLLRDVADERFDCSPDSPHVDYQVTVPWDDIAGTSRAVISLGSRSYAASGKR